MNDAHKTPRGVVIGHGLDVVDIEDFSRLLKNPARDFLDRYFTNMEMSAAEENINQLQKLAGRFAAKEAVLKAFGLGWGNGIAFTDVEVIILESGAPTITLHRKLAELQKQRGISGWLISISHTNTIAAASVIAIGADS